MKRLLTILVTILVLLGLSFAFTYFTHIAFLDYSFMIGLIVTLIIWFFSSKGGVTSRNADGNIQGMTGFKLEQQKFTFTPNLAFFTALAYTIITFAVMAYQYRSYF
ncbi:hypothetical protein HPT25_05610 [Bacillus sp. BRMEA1]|uniref:hypothetical protein n=1 Tax=Neobacillus endophyticus TaxID=2738405 RepID=UPI0015641772|nr:hypothetical protein [Neobacillus endophyticus]NRD76970.1 hypothetical protein [Neobacillus endophyticus]